jgi:glutamate carboxypeptidase
LAGRIAGWTDYNRELTFNVGRIEGGAGLNRVPHAAIVEGEFRAFQPEVFEAARKALLALSGPGNVRAPATGHPCEVRMEVSSETRPWPRNSETDRIFATWQEAGRSLGQEVLPEERGGLSDGNLVWDAVPTLDGLGPWGDNAHCSEWSDDGSKRPEFVDVGSFCPKALLNAVAIQNLLEQAGLRTA